MPTRIWTFLAAALICASCVSPADAQWARTIDQMVNRAGTRGPSQAIGGGFTRSGPAAPLAATRARVSLFEQSQPVFRSRHRDRPFSASLNAGQIGARIGRGARPGWGGLGTAFNIETATVSGLHATTTRELELPEIPSNYMPRADGYLYTPRPVATRFDELFGLAPTQPPAEGAVVGTTAERLEAQTDEMVTEVLQRGLELYRQATVEPRSRDSATGFERYRTCTDCGEKLTQAVQLLRTVRDLDGRAYVPSLLMAHAYLEQERSGQALNQLLAALRREPRLFESSEPAQSLDQYFGDAKDGHSAYLTIQMRRFARAADPMAAAPDALALSAYCAWRLGEREQARATAVQLEGLARDRPTRAGHLLDLALALQAALQTQ